MERENRIDLVNASNRRGLLLGLTLSEIMMIILFSLLLLFGVVYAEREQDAKRIAELEQQVGENETALTALAPLQDLLKTMGVGQNQIEDFLRELKLAQELQKEVEALKDEITALEASSKPDDKLKLEEVLQALRAKETELAQAKKKIEELQKALEAMAERQKDAAGLAQAMAEAGITPEQARQADKAIAALNNVITGLRNEMAAAGMDQNAVQKAIEEAGRKWTDTAMDNRALIEQVEYWKGKYEREIGGKGGKYASPCWLTNGVVEPIYDVALTDSGMIMRRVDVAPKWAEDYERLPVKNIQLMQPISQPDFMAATRPLFDYSNKKDCRFFVRIFDETSPNAKLIYQQRRRAVEGHFYIIDMKSTRF